VSPNTGEAPVSRRVRFRRRLILFAALLLVVAGFRSETVRALGSDNDGDGIDDDLEASLAERFLPTMYWDSDENCPDPIPRPILFRARHPTIQGVPATDYIVINYVQLYNEDCGFGTGHDGDNEAFLVFLEWDGSDWQFKSVSAVSHWDDYCETNSSSTSSDQVWIGENKHGSYADQSECGCDGEDECDLPTATFDHVLYNVGEPDHHFMNYLDEIVSTWSGGIWDEWKFEGAGYVSHQLVLDFNHFAIATWPDQPPPDQDCLNACYDQYQTGSCYCCESVDQCDADYGTCEQTCYGFVTWDSGC
jgi:hypothetical protein